MRSVNGELPEAETGAGAEEEESEDLYDDEDGAFSIEVEALEREAKDAAREFSRSLSRELKIGELPGWGVVHRLSLRHF